MSGHRPWSEIRRRRVYARTLADNLRQVGEAADKLVEGTRRTLLRLDKKEEGCVPDKKRK